jgi:hypothetical protein
MVEAVCVSIVWNGECLTPVLPTRDGRVSRNILPAEQVGCYFETETIKEVHPCKSESPASRISFTVLVPPVEGTETVGEKRHTCDNKSEPNCAVQPRLASCNYYTHTKTGQPRFTQVSARNQH